MTAPSTPARAEIEGARQVVTTCNRTYSGSYTVRTAPCERDAGHLGFCEFVVTVAPENRRAEQRWRQGATRLGIPYADYRAQILAGNRWCSGDGAWEPVGRFPPRADRRGGLDTACQDSLRRYSRAASRLRYAARKAVAS